MNKKDAATFLGLSEKTVERYKTAGKLSARLKRIVGADGKSRKVLDFNESDLERLKRDLSDDIVFPELTDRHAQTKTQTDNNSQTHSDKPSLDGGTLATVGQTPTPDLNDLFLKTIDLILEKQIYVSNLFQKLVLTEEEAAKISGLPKSVIRRARENKSLRAEKYGSNQWRIKRADLDDYIENL